MSRLSDSVARTFEQNDGEREGKEVQGERRETRSFMTAAQHQVEEEMDALLEASDRSKYEAIRRRNNM